MATASNGKTILTPDQAAQQLDRHGGSWAVTSNHGVQTVVTYAFSNTAPATMPDGVSTAKPFSAVQIRAAELALQGWSDVANIGFSRVGSGDSGDAAYSDQATILFRDYATGPAGTAGLTYYPTGPTGSRDAASLQGDVFLAGSVSTNINPVIGGWGQTTLVHELGHAIGIGHPSDYDADDPTKPTYAANAAFFQDSLQYSVMSYFSESNTGAQYFGLYPSAPQLFDILAAQALYGPNMSAFLGDTTYGFNSNAGRSWFSLANSGSAIIASIWDAGGVDTLDFSGYGSSQTINLNAGAFSNVGGRTGNVSIAYGAVIENAIGGSGADQILGNAANNRLVGNAGADNLSGDAGDDILIGGLGNDRLDGGAGGMDTALYAGLRRANTISLAAGAGTVSGGEGTDTLSGFERVQFADGYFAYAPADVAGKVYRLYQAALDRAPDQAGLTNWAQFIDAGGASLATLANGFLGSQEFVTRFGAGDDAQFVTLLYNNVLHRTPDAAGLQNWVSGLSAGQSRADLLIGFSQSSEFIADTASLVQKGLWVGDPNAAKVARLYDTVLDRLPDAVGEANWTASLAAGQALQAVADGFVASKEFQAKYGALADAAFIQLLYQNVLGRPADQGGLSDWTNFLGAGHSRAEVVIGLSESVEHVLLTAPHIDDGVWFA